MRYEYDPGLAIWTVADEGERPERKRTFPNYTDRAKMLGLRSLTFSYYDPWEGVEIECPNCGEIHIIDGNDGEGYEIGITIECYKCWCILANIVFPTRNDAEWAEDKSTLKIFDIIESRDERFQHECLRSPDQLPDIDESQFTLEWDTDEHADNGNEAYTLINHNGQVIFRELAFWENGPRYKEVAKILIQKYGDRLKDVSMTHLGAMYLGGDSFSIMRKVMDARKELFGVS